MVVIPAGTFTMGSPAGEGQENERPQHERTIAQPFAVGNDELTFAGAGRLPWLLPATPRRWVGATPGL